MKKFYSGTRLYKVVNGYSKERGMECRERERERVTPSVLEIMVQPRHMQKMFYRTFF